MFASLVNTAPIAFQGRSESLESAVWKTSPIRTKGQPVLRTLRALSGEDFQTALTMAYNFGL